MWWKICFLSFFVTTPPSSAYMSFLPRSFYFYSCRKGGSSFKLQFTYFSTKCMFPIELIGWSLSARAPADMRQPCQFDSCQASAGISAEFAPLPSLQQMSLQQDSVVMMLNRSWYNCSILEAPAGEKTVRKTAAFMGKSATAVFILMFFLHLVAMDIFCIFF